MTLTLTLLLSVEGGIEDRIQTRGDNAVITIYRQDLGWVLQVVAVRVSSSVHQFAVIFLSHILSANFS